MSYERYKGRMQSSSIKIKKFLIGATAQVQNTSILFSVTELILGHWFV